MSFCENDIIEININLINHEGCIDINNFKWINYQHEDINIKSFIDFDQNEFDSVNEFDTCRICELEYRKKTWKTKEFGDVKSMINKIKFLFEPTFILKKTLWDDVGYDLFKFYLVAAETGI